jgi:hypothetical protein
MLIANYEPLGVSMQHLPRIIVAFTLVVSSASALAAPITITSSLYRALARDYSVSTSPIFDANTTTTYGIKTLSASQNDVTAASSSAWTESTAGAAFDFTTDLSRTGGEGDYAATLVNTYFTATENTTYSLSGRFATDGATSSGYTYFWALLQDQTLGGTYLVRDVSQSRDTVDESFVLGVLGDADYADIYEGSLTGNLIAGHEYRFAFQMNTAALPDADGGATATGNINLTIGTVSVPEPAPLALLGLGIALLGLRRKA